MKKTFSKLLPLALLIAAFIIGCSKKSFKEEPINTSLLSEDKDFIELTIDMHDFTFFLSEKIKENSLKLPDLQSQLGNLQMGNRSVEDQFASIDNIFKGIISDRLSLHMKLFSTKWGIIKAKYETITNEVLEKECQEVLRNKILLPERKTTNQITPSRVSVADCGWRYYVCAAAATAGAIACHAAIITPTIGLGTPAAVAICGTGQVWAMVQCNDNYCD